MYYYYCKNHPNEGFISSRKISKIDLRDYQCSDDDCNGATNQVKEFDGWNDSLVDIFPRVFTDYADSELENDNYHGLVGMAQNLYHNCKKLVPVDQRSELAYRISMALLNGVE